MDKTGTNNKSLRARSLRELLVASLMLVFVLIISNYLHLRIDLTAEKRYSLSPETKEVLKDLKDVVFVRVFLDGDLPVGFKNMHTSIREMLDEFRIYGKSNIEYEFINPSASEDSKERERVYTDLYSRGLQVTNIQDKDKEGGSVQKMIVPGAIVGYGGVEMPVNLLRNNPGLSADENLNNSIQSLEYELIHAIKNVSSDTLIKIAFVEGHGELDQYQVGDITKELANFYQVDRGHMDGNAGSLDNYAAVIIAKPRQAFSEADKFVLDQYLMKGGKLLLFLDAVNASLDSMDEGRTVALINQLNLDDQLFRYGVRINPNLVQDIQCGIIPVNSAVQGQASRYIPAPWLYYPLLVGNGEHPATRNINLIKTEFPSSIDTLSNRMNVKKTILLSTSRYSRTLNAPMVINLDEVRERHQQSDFNLSYIPVGVLLEGSFQSVFHNRMLSGLGIKGNYSYIENGKPASLLIVADGDIIRNEVRYTAQGPVIAAVGYDKYSKQTFGNKDFVLNAVNYLTDESGLIKLRNKEFKLRLLDKARIRDQRLKWQLINTLLPVLLVVFTGIFMTFVRSRKYSS
jgi:ABC-2 type transport system permease protein